MGRAVEFNTTKDHNVRIPLRQNYPVRCLFISSAISQKNGTHRQTARLQLGVVGDTGIEPVTSCVSCKRANQLRQSPECS